MKKMFTLFTKGNDGKDSFKKVGTGKVPAAEKHLYENKADEYLVATGGGNICGAGDDKGFFAFVPILGYVNLFTGKKSSVDSAVFYMPTASEQKKESYFKQFDKLTIYRIKAVAPLPVETIAPDSRYYSNLYVLEVAEKNCADDFLRGLIDEYKKPVILHTKGFGDFILNKDLNFFEGECDWLGEKIGIIFKMESGRQNAAKALQYFSEEMYKDRENWDKKIRDFAAKKLTRLANQWLQDISEEENPEKISEEKFSSSIKIKSIELTNRGKFCIYCTGGNFFLGHDIEINGSFGAGLKSADIIG